MAFKFTSIEEFANQTEEEIGIGEKKYKPLEAGKDQILYIEEATYDKDRGVYTVVLRSVFDEERSSKMSFFFKKKDGSENKMAKGTVASIGTALAGAWISVPSADCIVHGIVKADVTMSDPTENSYGETVQYPRIFKFKPITKALWEAVKEAGWEVIEQAFDEEE